jgi:hypothetical protein
MLGRGGFQEGVAGHCMDGSTVVLTRAVLPAAIETTADASPTSEPARPPDASTPDTGARARSAWCSAHAAAPSRHGHLLGGHGRGGASCSTTYTQPRTVRLLETDNLAAYG